MIFILQWPQLLIVAGAAFVAGCVFAGIVAVAIGNAIRLMGPR